jgi:hypothetical protein
VCSVYTIHSPYSSILIFTNLTLNIRPRTVQLSPMYHQGSYPDCQEGCPGLGSSHSNWVNVLATASGVLSLLDASKFTGLHDRWNSLQECVLDSLGPCGLPLYAPFDNSLDDSYVSISSPPQDLFHNATFEGLLNATPDQEPLPEDTVYISPKPSLYPSQ